MLPDISNVEPVKTGFTPIPEGEYTGKITKIEEGVSKEKQTPYISFEVTFDEGTYKGRKVWKKVFLRGDTEEKTKKMLGMYAGVLESLGMTQEQRHSTKDIETLKAFADGLLVKVYVSIREYNGKLMNDVQNIEQNDTPF